MTFSYLAAVIQALKDDPTLAGLVDSNILPDLSLEETDRNIRTVHKALIAVSISDWSGSPDATRPIIRIDIRCRKSAEHCLRAVQAVKAVLDSGISEEVAGVTYALESLSFEMPVSYDEVLKGWRCIGLYKTIIKAAISISSFIPDKASPQPEGEKIRLVAQASGSSNILYRFILNGPGTISQDTVIRAWESINFCVWEPGEDDAGANTLKVRSGTPR